MTRLDSSFSNVFPVLPRLATRLRSLARDGVERLVRAGLVVLLGAGLVLAWTTVHIGDDLRWIQHTGQVLTALESLSTNVADLAQSFRQFMRIGDETYASRFDALQASLGADTDRFEQLTSDNLIQQTRIQNFKLKLAQQANDLSIAMERRRQIPGMAPEQIITANENSELTFSQITQIIKMMRSSESDLLVQRVRASDLGLSLLAIGAFATIGISVGLLVIIFLALRREFAVRKQMETALYQQAQTLATEE
jgi:CHASE3 domain sensor protein